MTEETGTLKELNVKAGDVVRDRLGGPYEIREREPGVLALWSVQGAWWDVDVDESTAIYTIVSRAPQNPKLWRDMTPDEKVEIWRGFYQGKQVQYAHSGEWFDDDDFNPDNAGHDVLAYRIKPEPVRETVTLDNFHDQVRTHVIKFDLIDGKLDPDSIRMKPLD